MTETVANLPLPAQPDRWRPTRAGLVNVWRYWDETFTFHRGRLLLRGPNGAGKSMALELLLPLLLDADISPSKLSSAAKPRGRLFDRVMAGAEEPTRRGFVWVEFVRGDQVFTVGARIHASRATDTAEVDFFTTSFSVGRELHLLDASRTPLSKKALKDAMGEAGRVHGSAEEHRAAVREVLFPGFSADRYNSVIGALLALRKEKLSQNLDLDKLSGVLSAALPPIDEHDIAAVAEGFERLDRRKAELEALEREVEEVRQLAAQQRAYGRAVVVGAAAAVRSAEYRRDEVTRSEREAGDELAAVEAQAEAVAVERDDCERLEDAIVVEIEALKDSQAYRAGADLADQQRHAGQLRAVADRAALASEARAAAHEDARAELDDAAEQAALAAANLERAGRDLHRAAAPAGAEGVVGEAEGVDEADDAEVLVRAWAVARAGLVQEVRRALEAHGRAVAERAFREEVAEHDGAAVDERACAARAAAEEASAALTRFQAAVVDWAEGCETLGAARVRDELPHPAEPVAVTDAVARLTASVQSEVAVQRSAMVREGQTLAQERDELETERARWAGERLPDPEAPPWRSTRADRPGAALWRLVDVGLDVPGHVVDGLEAALTGAGLVDAWVQPDGSVDLGATGADIVLTSWPVAGDTLASVLVPAADEGGPVGADVVLAVLSSVAVVDTVSPETSSPPVVVGRDGTYRLGNALGRGPDRAARLLGSAARERQRVARLAEIDAALADIEARVADLDRRLAALDRWKAAVDAELAARPSATEVEAAERAVADAETRLSEAENRLGLSLGALRLAEEQVRAALRNLTALGARHGLPTTAADLSEVEAALSRLGQAVAVWARRRRELAVAERDRRRAEERAARASDEAGRAAREQVEAEREATAVEGRVAALESAVGAEYHEVLRRLTRLEQERAVERRRRRELDEQAPVLAGRVGVLATRVESAAEARHRAEEERERAHGRLTRAADELGPDAGIVPSAPIETASAALAFAREVAADHPRVDGEAATVERLSGRVAEAVHQAQMALGSRFDLDRELIDCGWWVLRTSVGGVHRRVWELSEALLSELSQGRDELAAEEERLFEQTLAGSVRRALATRIRQSNTLVDLINTQLAAVRTDAAEVAVRLRWAVDSDQLDAVKAARALLLRDPADLSDDERSALQAFVRARVDQARAELEANAPWDARLRETLDYRAWHRFTLLVAHRDWDGEFRPATARQLQKLSTGERSIALHLPMIASLAAHYATEDGAAAPCPRLILLDELFAGVDTVNRAKLFGTFTAWDLDAVFTSDHEWCQYATLDGIAIHHLHPPTGRDPVTSTRFTWDGRRRQLDPSAA